MSCTSHENGPNADQSKICEDKIFDRVLPETVKIHNPSIVTKKRAAGYSRSVRSRILKEQQEILKTVF